MVRCAPWVVGVWFTAGSLHTSKVLATTPRVMNAICIFRFILFHLFVGFLRFERTGNCGSQGHFQSALVKGNVPSIIHAPPAGKSYHSPRIIFGIPRLGAQGTVGLRATAP